MLFTIIVIAISLSMDAFSLSLAYGTLNINKKNIILLSTIVGLFHFFMPQSGMIVGKTLLSIFPLKPDFIVFFVLTFIGIEMLIETFKKSDEVKNLKIIEMIMFGFAVSIDSFSVGIGLKAITSNTVISSLIFSLFSFIFTFTGLVLGKRANLLLGTLATLIGGIVLIIIGISYLV